ncbi:hypothetical protein B0H16DRAFT_1714806 [Mycena metata]|uniref:DUF4211 domain-containing protein n=1 Tax=Mycena metata TaxID=1033252 RepID=A0AAD7NRG2_9AGAR|nr:hypothetical protein B0H16DRAFT_1714806 [Mycena metata]
MVRGKRKRSGADAEAPAVENTQPTKRPRRVLTQRTIPVIDTVRESDSDAPPVRKPRKSKSKSVAESVSSSKVPKKAKRLEPEPAVVASQDSGEDEDTVLSPPKRRIRRKVEVASDSDDAAASVYNSWLRRGSSLPAEDLESESPPKGRLSRKVGAADVLDSDDDPEDLALPAQPSSSRPTKKQLKSSALERYAKARKNKSSPAPVPSDAAKDEEEDDLWREFTPFSEVEEEDEEQEEDAAGGEEPDEDTFIVDEDDADADADANAALDRMRYSHRELDEHFSVFVEYIIALPSDSDYFSTATEDEKEYFDTAVNALRRHIDPLADAMTLSTWKAPFIATLNLRPILDDGLFTESTGDCMACWTRGMYACDVSGAYTLSTRKGIYDHKTFQAKPEKHIKYGKATSFENNAEARNLPYPPGFELIIGKRCFNRAVAYHEARHYMYELASRVKEKIKSLCEEEEELANDPNALFEAMKDSEEGNFITYLWGRFKSDKKQWAAWSNRKDQDTLT